MSQRSGAALSRYAPSAMPANMKGRIQRISRQRILHQIVFAIAVAITKR